MFGQTPRKNTPRATATPRSIAKYGSAKKASRSGTPILKKESIKSQLYQSDAVTIQKIDIVSAMKEKMADGRITVDVATDNCAVSLVNVVYVWNYKKASVPIQTLYLPIRENSGNDNVFCTFIGLTGLFAINSDGLARFWDNLSLTEHYTEINIPLTDRIVFVSTSDSFVLIGMADGSAVKISIEKSSFRNRELSFQPLQRRSGVIYMLGFGGDNKSIIQGNDRLISSKFHTMRENNRRFYILSEKVIQKWTASAQQDNFVHETSIQRIVSSNFPHDVEAVDLDIARDGSLVLLLKSTQQVVRYHLAVIQDIGNQYSVSWVKNFKFDFESNEETLKLSLSNGGPICLLHSAKRCVVSSFYSELEYDYEHPVSLKFEITGFGVDNSRPTAESESKGWAIAFTNQTILELEISFNKKKSKIVPKEIEYDEFAETYAKLEQAIFFGGKSANPISFELKNLSSDINGPCLELSKSIMNSENKHLLNILDDSTYMNDSLFRLDEIIQTLKRNNLVQNLLDATAFELLFNAEKVAAMRALWLYQNTVLKHMNDHPASLEDESYLLLLERTISTFVSDKSLRDFFRTEGDELPKFIMYMQSGIQQALNSNTNYTNLLSVYESTKLINTIFSAGFAYRKQNHSLYNIESDYFTVEPWTGTNELLNSFQIQFELLTNAIDALEKNAGEFDTQNLNLDSFEQVFDDPKRLKENMLKQLLKISQYLLQSFHDRKNYLKTTGTSQTVQDDLMISYHVFQKKAIDYLRNYDQLEGAFYLAETFHDLDTLVGLTLSEQNVESRARSYINRFGNEFAQILYQAYFDGDQLTRLMQEDKEHPQFLQEYLQKNNLGYLSWIQYLNHGQYEDASKMLWNVANEESDLSKQAICVALSKLSYLNTKSEDSDEKVEIFETAEDFIVQQKSIYDDFLARIVNEGIDPEESAEQNFNFIIENYYSVASEGSQALLPIIKRGLQKLLALQKLQIGEITTILAYQNSAGNDNFFAAWELIQATLDSQINSVSNEVLEYQLVGIWRKCWLSDDWNELCEKSLANSDEDLIEALKQTNIYSVISGIFEKNLPEDHIQIPAPSDITLDASVDLSLIFPELTQEQVGQVGLLFQEEQLALERLVKNARLDQFLQQCLLMCKSSDSMQVDE
ncbi:hypothetical protein HDV06_004875 [Boothiomyces sp. JEL0866]|nr:hypothetical protein HDV06_004875 [Boothiomyces sp. JEL0866]